MKRLIIFGFVIVLGLVLGYLYQDKVSIIAVLGFVVLLQLILIISMIIQPVREFVVIDKPYQIKEPSLRDSLNLFRQKGKAYFYFKDGGVLYGELESRHDPRGTIGVSYDHPEKGKLLAVVLQSDLIRIDLPYNQINKDRYQPMTEWSVVE